MTAQVRIARADHIVLTVADLDRTTDWYARVLGMRPLTFGEGRRALAFGEQKLNLHRAGAEHAPFAARPTPGSADLCLMSATALGAVERHLGRQGVAIEEGPVERTARRAPSRACTSAIPTAT